MSVRKINLTSAEIASLWTEYMNQSMSKCMFEFMLKHIEDTDIHSVVQQAYDLSSSQVDKLHAIFEKDNYTIPTGFTDQDVNMDAPRLYTDIFCLTYVSHIAKVGMVTYSGFISMSTREDIRSHFTKANAEVMKLYNNATDISLSKGLNARHPHIEVPQEINFVDNKDYLSGLNPFNEKRPLNAIEISHLYQNIATNSIGVNLCLSFAQTSPTKEVQEFMIRCKEISKKHVKLFVEALSKDDINAPQIPDVGVSDSTKQTFSDKLMMFHISLLMSAGIGNYATSGAVSQRSDLNLNYERLSLEVAKLAKSGADIMITNNWLEQPPGVKDRDKLAREKE